MHSVLIRTAEWPSFRNKNSVLFNKGERGGRAKTEREGEGVRIEVERLKRKISSFIPLQ